VDGQRDALRNHGRRRADGQREPGPDHQKDVMARSREWCRSREWTACNDTVTLSIAVSFESPLVLPGGGDPAEGTQVEAGCRLPPWRRQATQGDRR
jgi:hypothetical protein